jgi:hypothetical protein
MRPINRMLYLDRAHKRQNLRVPSQPLSVYAGRAHYSIFSLFPEQKVKTFILFPLP